MLGVFKCAPDFRAFVEHVEPEQKVILPYWCFVGICNSLVLSPSQRFLPQTFPSTPEFLFTPHAEIFFSTVISLWVCVFSRVKINFWLTLINFLYKIHSNLREMVQLLKNTEYFCLSGKSSTLIPLQGWFWSSRDVLTLGGENCISEYVFEWGKCQTGLGELDTMLLALIN